MWVQIKVNVIQGLSVESLHFYFQSHFLKVVSPDGGVFKHGPDGLILLELEFFDDFSSENFTNHGQWFELPDVNVSTAVTNQGDKLWVFWEGTVFVFARDFDWKVFDGLVGVERRVKHVQFLLKNG